MIPEIHKSSSNPGILKISWSIIMVLSSPPRNLHSPNPSSFTRHFQTNPCVDLRKAEQFTTQIYFHHFSYASLCFSFTSNFLQFSQTIVHQHRWQIVSLPWRERSSLSSHTVKKDLKRHLIRLIMRIHEYFSRSLQFAASVSILCGAAY